MRYIKIASIILVVFIVILYVVLFTALGNSMLRPVVQAKISKELGMPVELQKFHLSLSDIDLILNLSSNNSLHVFGKYSPFGGNIDLKYDVNLLSLADLKALTKQQLAGSFKTEGSVRGDLQFINVDGVSDVAKSATSYHIEITEFAVSAMKAKVKDLQVDALLYMLTQPDFVHASLDLDLNFKNIKPHQLDGVVYLQTRNGVFDVALIKQKLGITIPHTEFVMKADAKLQKENIDYNYLFDSNLLKLITSGKLVPNPLNCDIFYKASIKELALLKPITHTNLQGHLNVNGTLKGDKKEMLFKLYSDLAGSKTSAALTLKEFKPSLLQATIEHLRLEKLFYMLQQPRYAQGDFNLQADVDNFKIGSLKGKITTLAIGSLNTPYLTKAYKFKYPMPQTNFKLQSISELKDVNIDTLATLTSSLADLSIKKARFNVKKGLFDSDYLLRVPSLQKLYFVIERHLRGNLEVNGEIHKAKVLSITAYSKIADGAMKAKLIDEKLHVDLNDARTKKALWMLYYPEIFDGGMSVKVDYDLKNKKGVAKADFKDGKFVKNHVFDALKQFGKVDLYKEYFSGDAKADINKEQVAAVFDFKSRKAEIQSEKTLLDTKRSIIDSKIELRVNKSPVTVTLKGDIAKPMVGVDLKSFMQSEAGKKLEKKADKELKRLFDKLF